MPAMMTFAASIALDEDGRGIVDQQLAWHTAEVDQRLAYAIAKGGGGCVASESNVTRTAVSQSRDERQQRIATRPNMREIGQHLLTRWRLETHDRVFLASLVWGDQHLQLRQPPV